MSDVITTILRQIHTEGRNKSGEKEQASQATLCSKLPINRGERPEISPHISLSLELNEPQSENPHTKSSKITHLSQRLENKEQNEN